MKTNTDDVELIVTDTEGSSVVEPAIDSTIGFERNNDGNIEHHAVGQKQLKWSMDIELSTDAIEKMYKVEACNRFRRESRALFALVGLWKASGGDMSVKRHIRKLLTSRY